MPITALIIAQGGEKLIFVANRNTASSNKWWKAVIRQDEGNANPALVSFQPADDRELRREALKGAIVFDRR